MKFGVSSYVWVSPFSNHTTEQLKHAKELGFDIYEIGVEDPSSFDPAYVKQEADMAGIQINICGAFGPERDISSDASRYRDKGMEYIRTLIDMASVFGSPYVAGPMYAATGKAGMASEEERTRQRSYAVDNLRALAGYAATKGIRLALEPLNRFETDFLNTVDQGVELLDEIGCDNVGLLLDTFHMNIEEKSLGQAIRRAGSRLFDFHACSNDRGTPGQDHIDWDEISKALRDVGYDGAVVIESFTTDITEIAKAVSLWRPLAASQDVLALEGLKFLKENL